MKPAPAMSILSNMSELIRALISSAILRGLVRKIFAVCMAKFVAKSPNSFLGGTSNATSGNVSENFNAPSFIAAATADLIAAAIFSLACKSFPPLKFWKYIRRSELYSCAVIDSEK